MNDARPRRHRDSPTLFVLRLALTVAWLGVGATTLSSAPRQGGAFALGVAGMVVFIAALWACLADAPTERTRPRAVVLLAVQVVAGILVATDLMFLVAIELPLVLRPRHATIGFVVLVALVMLVGFAEARFGTFYAAPELASLSRPLQVWLTMAITAGWLLLSFAGGRLAATEAHGRREIARLAAELELTNQALADSSREAERLHIARELHDTVGHRLAALGISLDLESRRAQGDSATALREARDATHALLGEVRDVVGAMRQHRPIDLKRAIAQLVRGLGPLEAELTLSPGFAVRDPARAHALLRCAQEALTNVVRHAGARRVRLDLAREAGGITLRVRDDGVGPASIREGHGLRGMRERLALLGGTLSIAPHPHQGLEVLAWLPPEEDA